MKKGLFKKILGILEVIVVVVVCVFCLFAILQKTVFKENGVFGLRSYVVVSDSMYPELKIGDVILVKDTELSEIKVGDVLTYEGMVSDYAGKIITHRVKSIAIEDGEYIFYCQGVNNTLSDPAVYESQIVGVMAHRFVLLSFFSRLIRNGVGFWIFICIPLVILFVLEIKNMGKEIKNDVNEGKKEKKIKEMHQEKLKQIEERKAKLLASINTHQDDLLEEKEEVRTVKPKKKIEVKEEIIQEEGLEETVQFNIKSLDSYDEDYLENDDSSSSFDEESLLEDFKKQNKKSIKEEKKEKQEVVEDKFNLRKDDEDVTPITEDELLDSTSQYVVPIKVSDGLVKKKAPIKNNAELTKMKRKARGIESREIDITNEIDGSAYGYDITSDIEDDLEKTKEFDFSSIMDYEKETKPKSKKNNKKDANYDLPKLK